MEAIELVRCINCAKFSVQRAGEEWQSKGFGCCERRSAAILYRPLLERDCGHFSQAEPSVIRRREACLETTEEG